MLPARTLAQRITRTSRVTVHRVCRSSHVAASLSTTRLAVSSTSSNDLPVLVAAGAATALGLTATLGWTLCEPASNEDGQESESDPYDNLPDDDEPTNCSMCNTFRKGPCRPQWRKLERCFKDHESEENGATQCMRYFMPHQECLQKYTNLYHLVSLEFKQELVEDTEKAIRDHERRTWDPKIDWSIWKDFAREQGLTFRQTLPLHDKTTPLWKRLPPETEPVLLTIPVKAPSIKEGLILKVAYAIDQNGMVLGFTYNDAYGELVKQSNENLEAVKAGKEPPHPATSTPVQETTFAFDFFLLPGDTKQVRVYAMYAEDPVTAAADKDLLDAVLCGSRVYSLAAEAYESRAK